MDFGAAWVIDGIGWLGALSLLAAYGLVSSRRVDGASTSYQLLNLGGGAALVINTVYYGAYPSTFVNVVWIGIALYSLAAVRRAGRGPGVQGQPPGGSRHSGRG